MSYLIFLFLNLFLFLLFKLFEHSTYDNLLNWKLVEFYNLDIFEIRQFGVLWIFRNCKFFGFYKFKIFWIFSDRIQSFGFYKLAIFRIFQIVNCLISQIGKLTKLQNFTIWKWMRVKILNGKILEWLTFQI